MTVYQIALLISLCIMVITTFIRAVAYTLYSWKYDRVIWIIYWLGILQFIIVYIIFLINL